MGTYFFQPPTHRYYSGTTGTNQDQPRQGVENFRNCIKNGFGSETVNLNKALPSPRWVVSDIARFNTGSTYDLGYAFVIRDTTEGCEWLITMPGLEAADNSSDGVEYLSAATTGRYDTIQASAYAPQTGNGSTGHTGPTIGFSPDYATWTFSDGMGFDNTTALTYTGGDFTDLTTPSTKALMISDFMYDPAGGTAGVLKHIQLSAGAPTVNTMPAVYGMVVCEEAASIAIFHSQSAYPVMSSYACLSKRLFTPNEVGDTNTFGGLWFQVDMASTQWWNMDDASSGAFGLAADDTFIYDYDLKFVNNYTLANYTDSGGDLRWRLITATSTSDDKGVIHKDVAREIGVATRIDFLQSESTDTVPMKCIARRVAVPWPTGVPHFPVFYDGWGESDVITVT